MLHEHRPYLAQEMGQMSLITMRVFEEVTGEEVELPGELLIQFTPERFPCKDEKRTCDGRLNFNQPSGETVMTLVGTYLCITQTSYAHELVHFFSFQAFGDPDTEHRPGRENRLCGIGRPS